jgi:hypothetical protein
MAVRVRPTMKAEMRRMRWRGGSERNAERAKVHVEMEGREGGEETS